MRRLLISSLTLVTIWALASQVAKQSHTINLPSSKQLITPVPGSPQQLNSFPTAVALTPDHRYLAILNNGFGTAESEYKQSIAVLDIASNAITDFPDARMTQHAAQSFFMGLAFSSDGSKLFASVGSLTDPDGNHGGTGNGIAVYRFASGKIEPRSFLRIPAPRLSQGKKSVAQENEEDDGSPLGQNISYPAG